MVIIKEGQKPNILFACPICDCEFAADTSDFHLEHHSPEPNEEKLMYNGILETSIRGKLCAICYCPCCGAKAEKEI